MKLFAALMLLFVMAVPAAAQPSRDSRGAILAALDDSAEGWSRGDIDRFLAVYSDDPATSFTGSKSIERGKASIRARYLKNYRTQFGPKNARTRSALSFALQDFRMLGDGHALLIAQWKLVTPGKRATRHGHDLDSYSAVKHAAGASSPTTAEAGGSAVSRPPWPAPRQLQRAVSRAWVAQARVITSFMSGRSFAVPFELVDIGEQARDVRELVVVEGDAARPWGRRRAWRCRPCWR